MWEIAVHLAVAGGVYDGVFLGCLFFPRDVLEKIWDLIESVSEGFSLANERLCPMRTPFTLKIPLPLARIEPGTARSVDQRLTH